MNTATTVKERPILFSGPMVRALLDGRKTMTRRVIKGPVEFIGGKGDSRDDPTCWGWADEYGDYHTLAPDGKSSCDESCAIPCPYGRVGDRLWVRETWGLPHYDTDADGECWGVDDWDGPIPKSKPPFHRAVYAADGSYGGESLDDRGFRWRPSIHMPRWASRITLEIAGVRAERLQDISEEDAIAEGMESVMGDGGGPGPGYKWKGPGYWDGRSMYEGSKTYHATWRDDGLCGCNVGQAENLTPAVCAYRHLWDSINGKTCPWASSPWVWAITFKVLEIKGGQS